MKARRARPAATPMSQSRIVPVNCWQRSGNFYRPDGTSSDQAVRLLFPIHLGDTSMRDPARILIVDDNETNRDILMTRLEKHGYELLQAADGEEALASAIAHLPDLILLDVEMPKLDGFEVCRRLKSDASLPFMPIILCTAKADSADVVAGLD